MEHFWPGDSKDPANSLKNMMHKTRNLLHTVFPDEEELLVTQQGGYEWNKSIKIRLDVDTFEQAYREFKFKGKKAGVDEKIRAAELYTGEILPGTNVEWLDHLNTYYRTVYIDLCKALVQELQEQERWDDVIRTCNQAYMLEPEIEEFTSCYIKAMVAVGLSSQAIRHYEDYRVLLWEEFSLVPSDAVEQAYTLAVYANKNSEDAEEQLIKQIAAPIEQYEAFYCDMLVFQNIVQLELRHMSRSKHDSSIVILHTENKDGGEPPQTDIRRIERVLRSKLRAGDPFTRLNKGSFAILLSSAAPENANKVMERVEVAFQSTYPRSRSVLRCKVYPLELAQN